MNLFSRSQQNFSIVINSPHHISLLPLHHQTFVAHPAKVLLYINAFSGVEDE